MNQQNDKAPNQEVQVDSRFMDLMSDYGIKTLLGDPKNEELTIHFLNAVLDGYKVVNKITYADKEILGPMKSDRSAIVDILCNSDQDDHFIIELQRVKQKFFKDRGVFYVSHAIVSKAPKGKVNGKVWDYEQSPVIFIGLMDFELEDSTPETYKYFVQYWDQIQHKLFYDKTALIYLELPKFAKQLFGEDKLNELSPLGKWLYAIKNMARLSVVPKFMQEGPFKKVVEMSEVKNMTKKQRAAYQQSLRNLWDENGMKSGLIEKGRKEVEEEAAQKIKAAEEKAAKAEKDARAAEVKAKREKLEAIKKLLQTGMSSLDCAKIFNVDQAYVMDIQKSIKRKG